jgi:hypothetical protein
MRFQTELLLQPINTGIGAGIMKRRKNVRRPRRCVNPEPTLDRHDLVALVLRRRLCQDAVLWSHLMALHLPCATIKNDAASGMKEGSRTCTVGGSESKMLEYSLITLDCRIWCSELGEPWQTVRREFPRTRCRRFGTR